MYNVYAPNPGYEGLAAGVEFTDGHAQTDDPAALAYFRQAGYRVVIDARDAGTELVGTPLRDAAVDPRPEDFLAPVNAGQADPHGPDVVSPGLHGVPPAPLVPGPVSDSPEVQDAVESLAADAALAKGVDVGEVTDKIGEWNASRPADDDVVAKPPAGNGSTEAWAAYARSIDVDVEEGASRADIRAAIDAHETAGDSAHG